MPPGLAAPFSAVAKRAGVGQGSLYRHFPDRTALAVAVFEDNVRDLEEYTAAADRTIDATGKHRIRGRMTLILAGERKVRILKDTGKYTTVPFAKLSGEDRTFVARFAAEPSVLLAETR